MAAVADAKRFLYLNASKVIEDNPVELLGDVVKGVEELRGYLTRNKSKLPANVFDTLMGFIE